MLTTSDLLHSTGCPDIGIAECLTCPLPQCRFDAPIGQSGQFMRRMVAKSYASHGLKAPAIAALMGMAPRTVHRYLQQ